MKESQNIEAFKNAVLQGIPSNLPARKPIPLGENPAPKRKDILSNAEKTISRAQCTALLSKTLA